QGKDLPLLALRAGEVLSARPYASGSSLKGGRCGREVALEIQGRMCDVPSENGRPWSARRTSGEEQMRPRTSVRQPVIAGVGRRQLSEMLRRWRRQPRKRSLLLFWILLALGLVSDSTLLLLGSRLLGVSDSSPPVERRIHVPYASDADLWEPLRPCVVRVEGRARLFESFCGEAVKRITGAECFEGRDPLPVVVSWMLDGEANSLKWDEYPLLRCEDADLRAILYGEGRGPSRMTRAEQRHGRYVEPMTVSSSRSFRKILRGARTKHGLRLSPVERQAVELQKRLTLFQQIRSGRVIASGAEMRTARGALREAYQSGDKELFAAALSDFLEASRRDLGVQEDSGELRRLTWESWLHDYAPVRQALYWSLLAVGFLAAAALVRTRRPRLHRGFFAAGLLACLGCLGWAAAGIIGQALRDGVPLRDGSQGVLWWACVVLVLGLVLTVLFRDAFVAWTAALLSSGGFLAASRWSLAILEPWPSALEGTANTIGLDLPVLILLSAYAALALAWSVASLTLARVLLASPSSERLRRLTTLCVGSIRLGIVLLTASALLECCRGLEQGFSWRGWNAQAIGTFVVLPGCAALVHARRRGWLQPFSLLVGVVLGLTFLAMIGHSVWRGGIGETHPASALAGEPWLLLAGLFQISLAAHAALRYYFSKQRILAA
ncbi:MAG: hypothetical protein ACYC3I_25170, partial [Gemmataceae bacterium]